MAVRRVRLFVQLLTSWLILLPAAFAATLPSPPAKVIFIPGIMGSALEQDGKLIWGKLGGDANLRFDVTTAKPVRPLPLTRMELADTGLGQVVYGDFFDELKDSLAHAPNAIPFSYDWRASNAASAVALNDFLCDQDDPGEPTVFVAHSMGGLVLRHWIRLFYGKPCTNGKSAVNVAQLSFVASPLLGAPKSLQSLFFGEKFFDNRLLNDLLLSSLNRDGITFDSLYELFPGAHAFRVEGGLRQTCFSGVDHSPNNPLRFRVLSAGKPVDIFDAKVLLRFPQVQRKFEELRIDNPAAFLQDKLDRARENICLLAEQDLPRELADISKYYIATQTLPKELKELTTVSLEMSHAQKDFLRPGADSLLLTARLGLGDGTVPQDMAVPPGKQNNFTVGGADHLSVLTSYYFTEDLSKERSFAATGSISTVALLNWQHAFSASNVVDTSIPERFVGAGVQSESWGANFVDISAFADRVGDDMSWLSNAANFPTYPLGSEAARLAAIGELTTGDSIYEYARAHPDAGNWLFAASSADLGDIRRGWAVNNAAMEFFKAGSISEARELIDSLTATVGNVEALKTQQDLLATIYNNSGWINLHLQDFDAAERDFRQALDYNPKSTGPVSGFDVLQRLKSGS